MCEVYKEPQSRVSPVNQQVITAVICQDCVSKRPLGKPDQKRKDKLSHGLTFFIPHLKYFNCLNFSRIKAR